jgi:hypothetical protein
MVCANFNTMELSPKRRGGDFEMVIPIILNVSSTRFTRISKEQKGGYKNYYY